MDPIAVVALVAALFAVIKTNQAGPQGPAGAAGAQGPPGDSHRYTNVLYVDPDQGDNTPRPNIGTYGSPFETLDGVWDFLGEPTDKADFEAPWTINMLGIGSANVGNKAIPTRRITINAPGMVFDPLKWNIDDALRFGSTLPPTLAIIGSPANVFLSPLFSTSQPSNYAVLGDGNDALMVKNVGGGAGYHHVYLSGMLIKGRMQTDGVTAFLQSPLYTFDHVDMQSTAGGLAGIHPVGAPAGPGIISIVETSHCNWVGVPGPNIPVAVQFWANADACLLQVDAHVSVAAIGTTICTGFRGVNFSATSVWTGPLGSLVADATTLFWITFNGTAGVTTASMIAPSATPANIATAEILS